MYSNQPPPSYSATFNNGNQNMMFSSNYPPIGGSFNYPNNGVNYYEQAMMQRQIILQQQREYQNKLLQENYPVRYVIIHSFLLGSLSITAIVIQILVLIEVNSFSIGGGVWVGVFLLIAILIALVVSKQSSKYMIIKKIFKILLMICLF